jgi:hypothetical protein
VKWYGWICLSGGRVRIGGGVRVAGYEPPAKQISSLEFRGGKILFLPPHLFIKRIKIPVFFFLNFYKSKS